MSTHVTIIKPSRGFRSINLRELWNYRDLFYFMVWRDIKVRYAQSVLGIGWAIVQPVMFMIVFTVIFGGLADLGSDGVPYAIFSYTALVPWTYFARTLTESTSSLIRNPALINRIYFPRLIIPLSSVLGKLVDFGIAMTLLVGLMVWFQIAPTIWALMLPVLVLLMMLTASGLGMWLTAMAVHYRDVQYGSSFLIQLLMYAAPVVYPASLIPDKFQLVYAINPMVGVIEGFRSAILGTNPMPWDFLAIGSATSIIIMISGILYFRRMERIFADVV